MLNPLPLRNLSELNVSGCFHTLQNVWKYVTKLAKRNIYSARDCLVWIVLLATLSKEIILKLFCLSRWEVVELCESFLMGGFSFSNTRLGFDSEIFCQIVCILNFKTWGSVKVFLRENFKIGYWLKLNSKKKYSQNRVISKIFKPDKKHQFGQTMARLLDTGCSGEMKKKNCIMGKIQHANRKCYSLRKNRLQIYYENRTW